MWLTTVCRPPHAMGDGRRKRAKTPLKAAARTRRLRPLGAAEYQLTWKEASKSRDSFRVAPSVYVP